MLNEYKKKRNFEKTSEPTPAVRTSHGTLSFVVQKHNARRLHYDFRLELDGVLKSWALLTPSLDPHIKRLAVMVEDTRWTMPHSREQLRRANTVQDRWLSGTRGPYSAIQEGTSQIAVSPQAEEILRSGLEKGKISFIWKATNSKARGLCQNAATKNDCF